MTLYSSEDTSTVVDSLNKKDNANLPTEAPRNSSIGHIYAVHKMHYTVHFISNLGLGLSLGLGLGLGLKLELGIGLASCSL